MGLADSALRLFVRFGVSVLISVCTISTSSFFTHHIFIDTSGNATPLFYEAILGLAVVLTALSYVLDEKPPKADPVKTPKPSPGLPFHLHGSSHTDRTPITCDDCGAVYEGGPP